MTSTTWPRGIGQRTELVVVRHGETVWHAENRYAGRSDVELTERGRRQAAELGGWAAVAGVTALWCSPLRRALDTAEAVAGSTGLEPVVDKDLVELDFGEGEGLTAEEMGQRFAAARERFVADPVSHHLPGGEDPVDAARRGLSALVRVAEAAAGGRVLVVAHNTLLRLALCRLLGLELCQYRRAFPSIGNCQGARLRYRDGEFGLLALNEHLTPEAAQQA